MVGCGILAFHKLGLSARNSSWLLLFFFSSRRRHTRLQGDWSSDVCSSDLRCQWSLVGCPLQIRATDNGRLITDTGRLAQRLEHLVYTQGVTGSKPVAPKIGRASCRERV